jgi:ribonuclease BN (tRNA processing enzyme)
LAFRPAGKVFELTQIFGYIQTTLILEISMNPQIKLQFLGTGTILSDGQRSCSATILDTPKEKILIDIGAGTLRRMAIENINIPDIHYIFITHFHPDHIADLVPYLFALKNSHKPDSENPLRVWGPEGLYRYIHGMEKAYGRWLEFPIQEVKFYELRRRLLDFPGFRVIWNKVIHSHESVGYRFEIGGKTIAFSGDSGYCQELIRLCNGADIAVLECSHPDEFAVKGHLSPSLAAKIAESAAVKKVILNHFYPDALKSDPLEVAKKYFSGEIVIANDGDTFTLSMEKE